MTAREKITDGRVDDAKGDIVEVIGRYLALKKQGREHIALCPFHGEKSPSFKINAGKGIFKCFGCGAHGDAIDFVMQFEGLEFRDAVERIIGKTAGDGTPVQRAPRKPQPEPEWRPIRTAPDNAPPPEFRHSRLGTPSKTWTYFDRHGEQVGYVARFETVKKNGQPGKEPLPMCWAVNTDTGEQTWRWMSFGVPRPLYGSELLDAHPTRPVLVVEGEKTADAARALFTGFLVLTWPGGGNAVDVADWALLAGRAVTLWGDWDAKAYPDGHEHAGQLMPVMGQPGTAAMRRVFAHIRPIATSVRFVRPLDGAPDGWDLADAPPAEGWSALAYGRENTVPAADYFDAQPAPAPATANDNNEPEDFPASGPERGFEFGKPVDVFGIRPPPQLPIDVLPECLRDYVQDQADLTGCDLGIIGLGALVAAAACITDGIRLQPKRRDPTWTESARLWLAVVGDPSTRKSPAIGKAVRHIKRLNHAMEEENEISQADYKWQLESWKEAKKADKNNPAPEPKAPPAKRLLIEDTTVEALTEVLKDNPRGVLTLSDELTGWFASMDVYNGAGGKGASRDRAHWLESYNGGERIIDRVTRKTRVPNWSTCIIGGIQPDMIRRISSAMGNDGLLQRFMVFCARPAREDEDRVPNMDAMRSFGGLFDHLTALQPSAESVTLTEPAHESRLRVARYAKRLIDAIDHPHIQAWLGKWDGLYARLLLLYHCIECYTLGGHPSNTQVSAVSADKVERLMCGVLLHHALHFYTEILDANDRQDGMRQLARLILTKGLKRLTKRDITIGWKASRTLHWQDVRAVLDGLCTLGWMEPDGGLLDSDGKPRAWHINPVVHEQFAQQAARETTRRRNAVEAMREIRDAYVEAE